MSASNQFNGLIDNRSVDSTRDAKCDGLVVCGFVWQKGLDQPHGMLTKGEWQRLKTIDERNRLKLVLIAFKSCQFLRELLNRWVFKNPFDENLAV